MSQSVIGTTAPPFHPNCRCTICPYYDDELTEGETRAARDANGRGEQVPADMTYSEWKKRYVTKKPVEKKQKNANVKRGAKQRNVQKQSANQLRKSIRSLRAMIERHDGYINDPASHEPRWESFSEDHKAGLLRHWNHELTNFKKTIDDCRNELDERGESYEI